MIPDIHRIRSFIAVSEHGSFRRAAEELRLSQPAVTKHIQDLEDQLGLPLMSRTTRTLRLTAHGVVFKNRMSRILDEINRVIQDLQEEASLERGKITIACVPTIASTILPKIIKSYSQSYPKISIFVLDEASEALEQRILAHEADFGVGPAPQRSGSLGFRLIARDEFVVVLNNEHPLAGRQEVTFSELAGFDYIAISAGNVRIAVDAALKNARIALEAKYEVLYPQTLARMVDEGLGYAILPSMTLSGTSRPELSTARLRSPSIHRDIGIVFRRGWVPSPACEKFLSEIDEQMPDPGAGRRSRTSRRGNRVLHERRPSRRS